MKRFLGLAAFASLLPAGAAAQAPSEPPQVVAYYYKVRWGFQEEFERLFMKNHHPVLADDIKNGLIRDVHMFRPTFHGDGKADWTFLVVITYPSWRALGTERDEAVAKRLFPEQETFQKEERRRFELLEAHWDVPLRVVPAPK
jgi:hypothetical protein